MSTPPLPNARPRFSAEAGDFIFEQGDVNIKVKLDGEVVIGRVCAAALSLASPVWKDITFPPLTTKNLTTATSMVASQIAPVDYPSELCLNFTKYSAAALLVILRIVHLQLDRIPRKLTPYQLFQVAVIADKYKCVRILRPFIEQWLKAEKPWNAQYIWNTQYVETNRIYSVVTPILSMESWLMVYWTFGDTARFEELAKDVLVLCTAFPHPIGGYESISGGILSIHTPPFIIDHMTTIRLNTVKELLAVVYGVVDKFTESFEGYNNYAYCRSRECDVMMYGSFLMGLQRSGLWPKKQYFEVTTSISRLAREISLVDLEVLSPRYTLIPGGLVQHNECRSLLNLRELVGNITRNIPSTVWDLHRDHMAVQNGTATSRAAASEDSTPKKTLVVKLPVAAPECLFPREQEAEDGGRFSNTLSFES